MNCRGWNPHIALYVEGDLEPDLARQLETHLGGCVECRGFADTLRETQAEMRQLRSEAIETSSLNRVRANVLQQVRAIEEHRTWLDWAAIWIWGGFRWRFALLGSVALVLFAVSLWRMSTTPLPSPEIASAMLPVIEIPKTTEVAATVVPVQQHMKPQHRLKPAHRVELEARPDTVVQILTDDPNVVIYWLIDQTGGF